MPRPQRPLKRHPALQDLSREHHELLIACRSVRWLRDGHERARLLAEVRGQFEWTWRTLGQDHLRREEEVLLPFVREEAASSIVGDQIARIQMEHRQLQTLATRMVQTADRQVLYALGQLLHDHIRFEERTFFEAVQAALSEEQMTALGHRLQTFPDTLPYNHEDS